MVGLKVRSRLVWVGIPSWECWTWVLNQKKGGLKPPKMDGENNGSKPYEQMDDLGGKNPYFWKHPYGYTLGLPPFPGFQSPPGL